MLDCYTDDKYMFEPLNLIGRDSLTGGTCGMIAQRGKAGKFCMFLLVCVNIHEPL